MQTKALGPRWPRAHDVVAMLAIAGAVVTEQVRPVRDLDLIDAGSRVCQVERLHDVGGLHRRVLPQSTVGVQSLTHLHARVWADM